MGDSSGVGNSLAAAGAAGGAARPKASLFASLVAVLKSAVAARRQGGFASLSAAKAILALVAAGSIGVVAYTAATGDVPFVPDAAPDETPSSTDDGDGLVDGGGGFGDATDGPEPSNVTDNKSGLDSGRTTSSGDGFPLAGGETDTGSGTGAGSGGGEEPALGGGGGDVDPLGDLLPGEPVIDPDDPGSLVPSAPTLPPVP